MHDGVRLLAKGEINANVTIEVAGASKPAIEAIEKAGGKVTVIARPKQDGKHVKKTDGKGGKGANSEKSEGAGA